jgi:RNA polymerase sigma-70 factor (ECF subfamily)
MNALGLTTGWCAGNSASLEVELPALLRAWLALARPAALPPSAAADDIAGSGVAEEADWADVQASLGGDGDAYGRLVRRHQQAVGVYLWRFTRDRNHREELVHDVFVEAYFSLSKYARRGSFGGWLKCLATRLGYRYWQRRDRARREVSWPEEQIPARPDDQAEAARQAGETVHRLLADLSPRDRLVMTLFYLEQCTIADIAQRTGWSETAVKVQAHRARKRLQKICERKGIEP